MLTQLTSMAIGSGFTAIGFSRPERPLHLDRFHRWLYEHKNAGMSWLERNLEIREDPSRLLKGCRTIITLACPYPSQKTCTPDGFSVSRYSRPMEEDYHYRLKRSCRDLAELIRNMYQGSRTRICVDSAPILERSFACSSGIGFIGKNNMLIIPGYGSYLYLAEILTTAPIEFLPVEPLKNQCGSCSMCMDACPTGALERPFHLDASKCLSYLTIESGDPVDDKMGGKMGECFFGCDRCQEVCPFNKGDTSRQVTLPATDEFLKMEREEFEERFGKTAFARAGLEKIKMNIRAIKAQGETAFLPRFNAS